MSRRNRTNRIAAVGGRTNLSASTRMLLRYACEPLERRTLLTNTVFLDFGFSFPSGSITFGDGDMGGGVKGPTVFGASHTLTSLTQTIQNQFIDLNGDFLFDQADAQILANDVLSLVQREYAPFNVVVQAAAATNLTDVANTLALNGDGAGNRDAYIFVCGDDPPANTAFGWAPVDTGNDDDNTGFCFADEMIRSLGIGAAVTALGRTSAHEAAHTFGLEHTDGSNIRGTGDMMAAPEADPAPDLRDFSAVHMFSRYPLDLQDVAGTQNNYDLLVANVGVKGGFPAYVTGTGAHDRITLSNFDDDEIAVLVEPFSNSGLFGALTTYAYNIPKASGVLVEMGVNNDQLVINANIGVNVEVRGMKDSDRVLVMGNGAASAIYTSDGATTIAPDDAESFGGTLAVGSTTIDFNEFETSSSITVQDVTNLTLVTPNGGDDLDYGFQGTTQRVSGSSGPVDIVPLQFSNVTNVTIDTATNDGGSGGPDDEISAFASAIGAGLNTVTFNTGVGSDLLDVNFSIGNMIPAGGMTFNAGIEPGTADLLNLRNGSFTNEVYTPTAPDGGTINLDGSVITYLNLAPINDTAGAANVTFNGTAGGDTINLIDGPFANGFDTTQINSPSFELVNFANKANVHVNGQNGGDTFNVNLTDPADGLTALALHGEDQAVSGDDNAGDTFNLTPQAGALPITVNGNGGAGDILNVDGSAGSFELTNTTITSAGVQPITYGTVERLELVDGTYHIATAVNVTTPIHVNLAATLTGTGAASGGIAANTGGTVSPGVLAPGVLGSGNLAFNAGSTYTLDLNGTGVGTHDELNVSGTVNLNNTAALAATVGFLAIPGDEIVIIRNDGLDAVVGQFAGGLLLNFGGVKFTIDYAYDADGDNAFNDVALIRYGAQLAPDPCDPDEQALFVSATSGDDDVRVVPATGNSRGRALINGIDEGTISFKGHIYIMGQNGDDTVAVTMPARTAFLYGNTGDDVLLAGNADSILIGGFGNDTATAGNGKDLLIGGAGADVLSAGNGADILIAGSTTYDAVSAANRMALCDVMDIWKHGHKPAALAGLLNAATLVADNDVDQLFGQGGKDFFLLHLSGGANDLHDADKQEVLQNV